jgi:RNA polymerase sigma factor (sigma-70 family)
VLTFEEVFDAYQPLCHRQARRYHHAFRQIHDLDDLLQQAYIGLWCAYTSCENWQTFPRWAKMRVIDSLHVYCQANNHLIRVPTADRRSGTTYEPYDIAGADELPLQAVEYDHDTTIDIHNTLRRMPPAQARNLWAVCAEGWTREAFAREMGQHPNAIKVAVKSAKVRFRRLWEGDASAHNWYEKGRRYA